MKKVYLLVFLFFAFAATSGAFGQNTSERVNSNVPAGNTTGLSWSNASSWTPAGVPNGLAGKTQEIIIDAGEQINITDANTVVSAGPVKIIVNGILYFTQAGKLRLPAGSIIIINSGGDIVVEPKQNGDFNMSSQLEIGGATLAGPDLNAVSGPGYVDQAKIESGGPYTLPVNLLYFNASAQTNSVKINWATSKAWDFSHFEVERSENGKDFYQIGTVDADEFSNEKVEYAYSDFNPFAGVAYYRLKAVDIDGKFEYKGIAMVKFGKESFKVFPNPSDLGYVTVEASHIGEGAVASLKDSSGRTVRSASINKQDSKINTQNLPAGMYLLIVKGAAGIKQTQLMIK